MNSENHFRYNNNIFDSAKFITAMAISYSLHDDKGFPKGYDRYDAALLDLV